MRNQWTIAGHIVTLCALCLSIGMGFDELIRYNCLENQQFGDQVEEIIFRFLEYLPVLRNILSEDVDAILRGDPAAVSKRKIVLAIRDF